MGGPGGPGRGGWRAIGLSAVFLLGGLLGAVPLFRLGSNILWGGGPPPDLMAATSLQSASALLAYGVATWLIGFRVARLDATALRWRATTTHDTSQGQEGGGQRGREVRGFGVGVVLGTVPAGAAMLLAVPVAGARWTLDGGTVGEWTGSVAGLVAVLAPAALAEELIFRGVPMVLLAKAFGRATAVVALAALFGLGHLLNPDIGGLAVGNVALAGVFLGTAFYLPGGLWTATGAHLGWNLMLAVLAAPVSGLPLPVAGLDYQPGAPAWLSGGGFGPEGGLLATVALGAATLGAGRRVEKETGA